ncbi:lymphocyte-specific protein 1-like isoform X2 [Entelurus aequoreus]|uniref:lymphocyte-specific protein 1-like isoform X2 n=1 Tax=Entelurus aequoreus TaxID=161455 RepID=UPI002B1E32BC|nr:lymphocyte-specific protein 1-like isoform X2 [Entelurus aequoreus]
MSESIRRSSSRQLLQNLIKVTVQRSLEDAEEVERERRRKARESQREERGACLNSQQQNKQTFTTTAQSAEEVKPICCLVVEEDEGFSDWSHRLEKSNDREHFSVKEHKAPSTMQCKAERVEEKQQENEKVQQRNVLLQSAGSSPKKEVKLSYRSTVFPSQDATQQDFDQPADKTLHTASGRMRPHSHEGVCMADLEVKEEEEEEEEEIQQISKREWRSDHSRSRPSYGDDQEEGELNLLHDNVQDRHMEVAHKPRMQRSREERSRWDENRSVGSAVSVCSSEEEDALNCYGPMSPTFKKLLVQFYPEEVASRAPTDGCVITERTESLRKSANIPKKMSQPVCVSKIDKKLQQYTHALEISSKEGRSAPQVPVDLTSPALPVAHTKNMFEAGEVWKQNALTNTPSKEIQFGGVLLKKNMWERFGDVESPSRNDKECSTEKRKTCVVTGHRKYDKVSDEN